MITRYKLLLWTVIHVRFPLEIIKFVLLENVTDKPYVTLCSLPPGKLCLFMMTLMINGAIFIYTLLQECLNKFLPLKKVTSRKSKRPTPWFNDDILQQIKLKNRAKRTFM